VRFEDCIIELRQSAAMFHEMDNYSLDTLILLIMLFPFSERLSPSLSLTTIFDQLPFSGGGSTQLFFFL
jgi:hypothetical protein